MASELKLDIRSDGYVRVRDLLQLNLTTYAKLPLRSLTIDDIKEVRSVISLWMLFLLMITLIS